MFKKIAVAVVAAGGLMAATAPAHAGGHVSVSLGIGLPFVGGYVGPPPAYYGPPAVYAPAPVYYGAPAYYGPPRSYYAPRVVYRPAPRYYGPRGYNGRGDYGHGNHGGRGDWHR